MATDARRRSSRTNDRTGVPTDDDIIGLILHHEGSAYTNDPVDRGGPTKYGITLTALREWLHNPRLTAADVKALTEPTAREFYRTIHVRPFDRLPEPVRVNVIDFGVNAGVRRAAITLQQIIRATVDGGIGPETIRLANARDWNPQYVGARLLFYERLIAADPSQIKWRNGWHNRALAFLPDAVVRLPRRANRGAALHVGKAWEAAAL
jgi:lysozyme family protein